MSYIFTPKMKMSSLQPWKRYQAVAEALGDSPELVEPLWRAANRAFEVRRTSDTTSASRSLDDAPVAPTRSQPRRSRPVLVSGVLALIVLLLASALIVVIVGRSDVDRSRLDNSDPVASGCSDPRTDQVYYSSLFRDWPVRQLRTPARVELHYSVECRTAWAVLLNAAPGAIATLVRLSDGRRLSCISGPDGRCSTQQLDNADVLVHATGQTPTSFGQTRDT